jgi:hypothetical protein
VASRICDTEPCERMKEALRKYFGVDAHYQPDKGLLLVQIRRKKTPDRVVVVDTLNFKYCPFCGTRVALGLVDGLNIGGTDEQRWVSA